MKTRLFGTGRIKFKKAREDHSSTRGLQQPGHVAVPKLGEFQTTVLEQPRSEISTPVKEARPVKRPKDLMDLSP
jgi:hypothetical protein